MHFWPIAKDVKAVMVLGCGSTRKGSGLSSKPRARCSSERTCPPGRDSVEAQSGNRETRRPSDPAQWNGDVPGTYVLDKPARIHDLRGHMHVRGKYQIVEAIYPDGRER